MSNQNIKTMSVNLPGPGDTAGYSLEPDAQVKFDFDISDATFSNQGGDLIISVENGGSIILKDYLSLAEEGKLPTFEMQDGEQMPGDFYMFAFGQSGSQDAEPLETAAEGQSGGSGAGDYSDDAGLIGARLEALDGQDDAYDARVAPVVEEVAGEDVVAATETPEIVPPEEEIPEIVYPEEEEVQIVLNPSFEASRDIPNRGWILTEDVDHWKNPNGDMEVWNGDRMRTDSFDGNQHMELDSNRAMDQLAQAIAVQEGEEVNISFAFAARQHGRFVNPEECDIDVMLGDQLVATIQWNEEATFDYGEGEVVTGAFEVLVPGEGGDLVVQETFPHHPGEWFELDFSTTAPADHAELTFVDHTNTTYGAMIDNVTAYRDFHQVIEGGESGFIIGSEGDDAIFTDAREVIDGTEDAPGGFDFVYGGDGDDAIYVANGYAAVVGGDGDDFIVTGDAWAEIVVGQGNDYIRLGGGEGDILIDQSVMVDGSVVTVENFDTGGDDVMIGKDASLSSVAQVGDDLHLTIEADNGAEVVIELLGVSQTDTGSFVNDFNISQDLNDIVQDIIDAGSLPA